MIELKKNADDTGPFNRGVNAYNRHDFFRAGEEFRQALEEHPNYADYHFALAMAYRELGELEPAIESLRQALRFNANYIQARCELSILLAMNGQYDDARQTYAKVVSQFIYNASGPSRVVAEELLEEFQKGIEQLQEGGYAEAVVAFRHATNPKATTAQAHFNQAIDLFVDSDLESAKIELEQALKLDPFLIDAHMLACRIGQLEGNYDDALAACRRAIEIAPEYPDLHYQLALTCRALGELKQARRELEHALELQGEYTAAQLELADVAIEMGDLDRARQCLLECAGDGPLEPRHAFLLARYHEEKGELDEARQYYRQVSGDEHWEAQAQERLAILT